MRKPLLSLGFWAVFASLAVYPTRVKAQNEGLFDLTTTAQTYKDPVDAFKLAFFPGAFIHGRGHLFAQDRTVATALMTSEVISLLAMGLGFWENNKPNDFEDFPGNGGNPAQAQRNGRRLMTYGAGLFTLGWIADMAHAPMAADKHNARYNLRPIVRGGPEGSPEVLVAAAWRF